jgi:2-C-methyl-D-erythritol 2,4-cyclodiphosphate synthase
VRVGIGFDVHRLVVGRRLVLGGVDLPWDLGLEGHSDADVICHALIDAVCGAAGLGDVGTLYPDSEERFKDARSIELLQDAVARSQAAGFRVENADVTLLAQAPRLTPYREEMERSLAAALQVEAGAVNVKATTTDHLGVIGRGEALAAQAVVLLRSDG